MDHFVDYFIIFCKDETFIRTGYYETIILNEESRIPSTQGKSMLLEFSRKELKPSLVGSSSTAKTFSLIWGSCLCSECPQYGSQIEVLSISVPQQRPLRRLEHNWRASLHVLWSMRVLLGDSFTPGWQPENICWDSSLVQPTQFSFDLIQLFSNLTTKL